jgi:hypothetical protein
MSNLRQNIVYKKGNNPLKTSYLDYNLDLEVAHYFNNGELKDSTNTLKSEKGHFYGQLNYATFWNDVVLNSPDFVLKTDTLRYNSITKVAFTDGDTEIIKPDSTYLFAQGGEFRTYIDQSQFVEGNIETDDYILEGNELFFDDLNKYYKAIGNVRLTAKSEDVVIIGDEGFYDRERGLSKIYGSPVMKRFLEQDTFYLAADTLVALESEYDSMKRILAFPDIRVFKSNLQGISDSAAYFLKDSTIYMYFDPVLWTNESQISADTINMEVSENKLEVMNLRKNSFMISQDNLSHFNQVKGRNMTAYFENNDLKTVTVDGNGESIFYLLTDGDSSLMGMNRLLCSNLKIGFVDNDINSITVYKDPEGKIIPPHELTADIQKLDGFEWRLEEKPDLTDIFRKLQIEMLTPSDSITIPQEVRKPNLNQLKNPLENDF